MRKLLLVPVFALFLAGCYDYEFANVSGGGSVWWNGNVNFATSDVTLSAGMAELQAETVDNLSASVNASRFGVNTFDRVYELQTPADTDFSFNIVARGADNWGLTRVEVGHVADDGSIPTLGSETIAGAGMTLEAPGMSNAGDIVQINGDGFARVTVRGRISKEQVLVAKVPFQNNELNIGIRISIGNTSAINLSAANPQGFRPGMTTTDIYSSDSWQFGLPSIAVSGDRYSVVMYDGDPNTNSYTYRKRRWLQMDAQTSAVTGGEANAYSMDSGFWRDQEIAAQGNVLAVAYTGNGQLRAEISLDRGATFPIERVVDSSAGFGTRLAQIAIAPDYTLGVVYWKSYYYGSQLTLVEGTPAGFDANNDPTGFNWGTPQVIHYAPGIVVPLVMQMEYSQGGDAVIGYGYTLLTTGMASARYRCAVRLWGGTWGDKLVDQEDRVMPCDPHVSLLGSGTSMEIFYTYEKDDGVYLWYSDDASASFTLAHHVAHPGAAMPSVHARMQGAEKRVDLIYAAPDGWGMELHNKQWDDFSLGAAPTEWRITQSGAVPGGNPPAGMPQGWDITTMGWFGYDAVLKGDDVAIVYHELTYGSYEYFWAWGWQWNQPNVFTASAGAGSSSGGGGYTPPPTPTVLAPGMTGTVPTPDPNHRNQLKIAVLD